MLFKRDFNLNVLNINTFKLFACFVCKSYNSKYSFVNLYSLQHYPLRIKFVRLVESKSMYKLIKINKL